MELEELMGDAYKEGMTVEEISDFFKGKKFADLSTGNYVDKNKYDSEVKTLKGQLTAKTKELNDKLTDDEKALQAQADKDAEIERLTQLLSVNTINSNKNTVNSIMNDSKTILELDGSDKDFTNFVSNITTEDSEKTISVANYVSKMVKDAYEKGKKDATKNSMGNFGNSKVGGSQQQGAEEIGSFGKNLANLHNTPTTKVNYFEQ